MQYACRWLQIEAEGPQTRVPAGSTVQVREHRDGSLSLLWNHRKLRWHELQGDKRPPEIPKRRVVQRPKPARRIIPGGHRQR